MSDVIQLPTMAPPMGYFEAWEKKGLPYNIAKKNIPWSWSFVHGGHEPRVVLTIWEVDFSDAHGEEVVWTNGNPPQAKFVCNRLDGWQHKDKGVKYIRDAKLAYSAGVPVEVILLRGLRRNGVAPSKLNRNGCRIEPALYRVKLDRVHDDGFMTGDFHVR